MPRCMTVRTRAKLAARPLPPGFTVTAGPRTPFPGHGWRVTDPAGKVWESGGAFYDDHDGPGDDPETAALEWGRISVLRGTYNKKPW